jgi:hypothetical protein
LVRLYPERSILLLLLLKLSVYSKLSVKAPVSIRRGQFHMKYNQFLQERLP